MKHSFIRWKSVSEMDADLGTFMRNDQLEFGLYNLRRALEKIEKVDQDLRKELLERYHDQLIIARNVNAALELRDSETWKKEFGHTDTHIDPHEIQFIGAQFDQLCERVGNLVSKSPFDYAKRVIGLKRRHQTAHAGVAYATRTALRSMSIENRRDEIAVRLATEDYEKYGKDISRDDLVYFFEQTGQFAPRFFPNFLEKNVEIFRDFCLDLIEDPAGFSRLSDSAIFRILVIAYVHLEREPFDRMLNKLYKVYHLPQRVLRGPSLSTARILQDFRANVRKPYVITGRRLNIAVCVSGQLRGYAGAFASWKNLQLDGHNVRYFVHTWDDTGWRIPEPLSGNGVGRVFKHKAFVDAFRQAGFRYGVENLKRSYPNFYAQLASSSTVSKADVEAVYGPNAKVVMESHRRPEFENDPNNQIKMFYKIREAHRLMLEDAEKFDLVLRIRPDRAFRPPRNGEKTPDWLEMAAECNSEKMIILGGLSISTTVHAPDQFAIGSPEAIGCYVNTMEIQAQANRGDWFGFPKTLRPHTSLGNAMLFQGVRWRPLEGIYGAEPVPANIYRKDDIKRLLSLDLPSGPVTEMDRLLWNSVT